MRSLPFAMTRNSNSSLSLGRRFARQPLTGGMSRAGSQRPAWWRRFLPLLIGGVLLALAPLLANAQTDSLVVSWTSVGDDGRQGTAASYDLRLSETPITGANFAAAMQVSGVPAPAVSGTRQHATVRALTHGTVYYFAIRSTDDAGNLSSISNVMRWDWLIDTAPPGAPQGVVAARAEQAARITWSANSEADLSGYRVYRSSSAEGPFAALVVSPISAVEFVDNELPAGATAVWYQVTAVDATGNESAKSASVSLSLQSGVAVLATLEAAYPNPSRADAPVSIPVVMPSGVGAAVVDIMNGGGVRVRRIELNPSAGRQEVVWDGKNDAGRVVAPGAYRAWLIAGDTRVSIRLLRVPS